MSSLDYLDLCRLCLVKDRVGIPIFEDEGDVRQVFLKIAACLPVKVSREDKLPKKICDDCMYKLELFYQFWNTTANAEKQLLQWLNDVDMQDKQGYVTGVLNTSILKQEQQASENRLDGSVMQQVGTHQNNMGMGMMDNMGLSMPLIISSSNQQLTSVPMDTSGSNVQTVQAVPGPSSQATHDQIPQNHGTNVSGHHDDDEDSTDDEENESDDECDGDDGLPVKEESEEDPNRTIEPTTFVNVSLPCDEAGPSGLQQQKMPEMPEMAMPQVVNADNKTGRTWRKIFPKSIFRTRVVLERLPEKYLRQRVQEKSNLKRFETKNRINKLSTNDMTQISGSLVSKIKIEPENFMENEYSEFESGEISDQTMQLNPLFINTIKPSERIQPEKCMKDEYSRVESHNQNLKVDPLVIKVVKASEMFPSVIKIEPNAEDFTENSNVSVSLQEEVLDKNVKKKRGKRKPYQTTKKTIKRQGYLCTECNFVAKNARVLKTHMRTEHETVQQIFKCNDCDSSFTKKAYLDNHRTREDETSEKTYTCNKCGKNFIFDKCLKNHLKFVHKNGWVDCEFCGKPFRNTAILNAHKHRFHNKAKVQCEVCRRTLYSQESLAHHMLNQHTRSECNNCHKMFTNKSYVQRHMKNCMRGVSCAACGKFISLAAKLQKMSDIEKQAFVCYTCKELGQKEKLTKFLSSNIPGPKYHKELPLYRQFRKILPSACQQNN